MGCGVCFSIGSTTNGGLLSPRITSGVLNGRVAIRCKSGSFPLRGSISAHFGVPHPLKLEGRILNRTGRHILSFNRFSPRRRCGKRAFAVR